MSTKFEQLLDLIVNEEMDKANELFHEIVVEKSRDIYENLIAEEAEEEEGRVTLPLQRLVRPTHWSTQRVGGAVDFFVSADASWPALCRAEMVQT